MIGNEIILSRPEVQVDSSPNWTTRPVEGHIHKMRYPTNSHANASRVLSIPFRCISLQPGVVDVDDAECVTLNALQYQF